MFLWLAVYDPTNALNGERTHTVAVYFIDTGQQHKLNPLVTVQSALFAARSHRFRLPLHSYAVGSHPRKGGPQNL